MQFLIKVARFFVQFLLKFYFIFVKTQYIVRWIKIKTNNEMLFIVQMLGEFVGYGVYDIPRKIVKNLYDFVF